MVDNNNPMWAICERVAEVHAVLEGKSWSGLARKP